jgi:hypothetical protein
MKSPAAWQTVRLWTAAYLALLAGVLAAPAPVRAECGDYVVRTPAAEGAGYTGSQPMPAGIDPSTKHAPTTPQRGRIPCHGPGCSRHSPPPLVPVSTNPIQPDEWGTMLGRQSGAGAAPAGRLLDTAAPHPVRRASSIYHPPRPCCLSA